MLIKKKNRPVWKTCRNCIHSSFDYCRITYEDTYGFVWKTWDECESFEPERVCRTCEHYKTCPRIHLTIADKKKVVDKSGDCSNYEVNREMSLYIKKNFAKKAEQMQ